MKKNQRKRRRAETQVDARLQSVADKAANKIARKLTSNQVKGRGGYWGDRWNDMKTCLNDTSKAIPRGTFSKVGSQFGPLGSLGGELISQLTGRGDYEVKKNSIIHAELGPQGLSFSPEGTAQVRVQKREFLGVLRAPKETPAEFTQQQFRLQATDTSTFPWMSGISQHFTEWSLQGAIISYESTSSNYSASMALGTIAMATQYNSNDLPYTDMNAILQAAFQTRGNPSETLMHGIECDPSIQASDKLYVRRPGSQGPPNLYDHGVVTIATEGLPAASADEVIGRIYITYDVILSIPALPISAPYSGKDGVCKSSNNPNTGPPLGPTLALTSINGSSLVFGQTVDDDILLLSPASGPLIRPSLTPEQDNKLVAWMNDSTVNPLQQYVTFSRAGKYQISIVLIRGSSGVDPGAGAVTAYPSSNSQMDVEMFSSLLAGFSRLYIINVTTKVSNAAVVLGNFAPGNTDITMTLSAC
jgi:hypothetical protein